MNNERVDSRDIISDYIFYSKYSRVKPDGKKETWNEAVSRVMEMHYQFFDGKIKEENKDAFNKVFQEAWVSYNNQEILGSQRSLQYGGPQLLKNNFRSFNCSGSYCNRIEFFKELMELLLSGCGAGFSVQKVHTEQLPIVKGLESNLSKTHYTIEDSIEGWANSTGDLIEAYYKGYPDIEFDYSQIRPEGSFVSGGFKAPGPEPLKICHNKLRKILSKAKGRKLRPFELHLISCIIADAVISGGIRRSAMISIFDIDDEEMLQCKTGDWFLTYPELCRCNNSAAIYEDTPKEKYDKIFEYIQQYGEPGVVFPADNEVVTNPCCFSGDTLIAVADGRNAVPIKDLSDAGKQFQVYYKTDNDSVKITNAKAFSTGKKELIEIVLSNGSSFRCTRDHFLRLIDGEYILAEQSLGKTLSKFYSVKSVKYRTINSLSNGYARQYRMIWEFYNGAKPEGFEIDYIEDNGNDSIDNLELLSRDEHLKKTAERRKGENNPLRKYVTGELEYKEEIDERQIVEKSKKDYSIYKEDVVVVEIKELGIIEEVYDIEVEVNEHNFAIITKGHDDYMFSEGVFVHNCETNLFPTYINPDGSKEYGWSFCNLCEINGKKVKTEEDFYKACRTAAILGTFQAAYTENLPLLSEATRKIVKRDALLGVGITGMADNPHILFNERIQMNGARIVKETNKEVAKIIGINEAARTTVVKPSGNSSQLLGTGSGVHAYHFRKYIRNIQANNNEQALKETLKVNSDIANPSFWNKKNETVLSFPIELDDKAMVRTDFSTLDFLYRIYTTEKGWVMEGTNKEHPSSILKPKYRHNVSCTVSVKDNEWKDVADWIWEHRDGFFGLSFLSETGDLDYPQAPYTSYLDEKELAETYGQGAILSSGLIVDGLQVFGDIWTACNAATGKANDLLIYTDEYLLSFVKKHIKDGKLLVNIDGLYVSDVNAISSHLQHKVELRNDWVRRFKKFSKNYFNGDDKKCSCCLKHVNIFHQWQKIKNQKPVDWENVQWEREYKNVGENVATACSGGACELR